MKQLTLKTNKLHLLKDFSSLSLLERSAIFQCIEKNGKLYKVQQDLVSFEGNCLIPNSNDITSTVEGYYHGLNIKLIANDDIVDDTLKILSYEEVCSQISFILQSFKHKKANLNILKHIFVVDSFEDCPLEDKTYVNVKLYFQNSSQFMVNALFRSK